MVATSFKGAPSPALAVIPSESNSARVHARIGFIGLTPSPRNTEQHLVEAPPILVLQGQERLQRCADSSIYFNNYLKPLN